MTPSHLSTNSVTPSHIALVNRVRTITEKKGAWETVLVRTQLLVDLADEIEWAWNEINRLEGETEAEAKP